MRKELIVKSRSLAGTSDLTLLAKIKPGLVDSIESVTYKTRVKRLLEALNLGRANSQEYALLRPFSDAVERVGKIHSVRVTVFEPEDKVLLAVSFDGSWESYIRVLWQKVGALLDAIFCNTEGYPLASQCAFETWAAWVRRVQRETLFYYGMPGLTVDDVYSLRKEEALHRQSPGQDAVDTQATRQTVRSAEDLAWDSARHLSPAALGETVRQALQALSFIHRLTSLYVPDTPDGPVLQLAARQFLREFVALSERTHLTDGMRRLARGRFDEQLDWLLPATPPAERTLPGEAGLAEVIDAGQVQAGIVNACPQEMRHGCLVLLGLSGASAAAALLDHLQANVTIEGEGFGKTGVAFGAAFSYEGMRQCGLTELELECLPMEFRQGMEARASTLGDFRHNHPRRWVRPERNWPPQAHAGSRVQLAEVHCVVQMRARLDGVGPDAVGDDWLYEGQHALRDALAALSELDGKGVRILSVQPMRRFVNAQGITQEHFGFADGGGQPVIDPQAKSDVYDNRVPPGEILIGYSNQAEKDDAADRDASEALLKGEAQAIAEGTFVGEGAGSAEATALAQARARVKALQRNGSYLVIRKLRQDVQALEDVLAESTEQTGIPRADLLARMMGRRLDGASLAAPTRGNDFDYAGDPLGRMCPFHAHARRANPRPRPNPEVPLPPGGRFPRIMRRGMSYGPRFDPGGNGSERNRQPRGLVFMAYNASIGEQFEAIQRWLSGGNSTGGYSDQSDPFLGVAPNGQRRRFRFEHEGRVLSMALDGAEQPLQDPRPFVTLEWGAYLFAPSRDGLAALRQRAAAARPECPWAARRGRDRIDGLKDADIDAWKAALEDPEAIEKFRAADIWAAVRESHGGVMRASDYGVLVASREHALEVLCDPARFSVKGYMKCMKESLGEIFLGQDPAVAGPDPKAAATNGAIYQLTREQGFQVALRATGAKLGAMIGLEKFLAQQTMAPQWELNLNLRELVDASLQALCQEWFGLEEAPLDPAELRPGALRWDLLPGADEAAPRYPGHFTPPSRYIFQPHPGAETTRQGQQVGQRLTKSMLRTVKRHRGANPPTVPMRPARPDWRDWPDPAPAPVARAVFDAFAGSTDDEELARYLVGAMMGMLPTLDGNLTRVLDEWLRDGSFWRLRGAMLALPEVPTLAQVESVLLDPLARTLQLRPVPELVWRTATQDTKLGRLPVKEGEIVVVSLASVTHQCLRDGHSNEAQGDLAMVFGGSRQDPPDATHPTHACPGYKAAMGAMLGTLAALLASREPMRPSPARLAVDFVAAMPAPNAAPKALPLSRRVAQAQATDLALAARGPGKGWLLAEGDSWFDDLNHFGVSRRQNLLRILDEDHDYRVEQVSQSGDSLVDMASKDQLAAFSARLRRMVALGRTPGCILFSGGGNDVIGDSLAALLLQDQTQPEKALDLEKLLAKVGGPFGLSGKQRPPDGEMSMNLRTILGHYTAECQALLGRPVPILLHGYDYPIPDGRNVFGHPDSPFAWLYPAFSARGYEKPDQLGFRLEVMKRLIDCLNLMQQWVAAAFPGVVKHVDLRGTLSQDIASGGYLQDWANELHPTDSGFEALAARIVRQL